MAEKIRLVKRKALSRDSGDCRLFSAASSFLRHHTTRRPRTRVRIMKTRKKVPRLLFPNAWTDEMTPLRVIKVPYMIKK